MKTNEKLFCKQTAWFELSKKIIEKGQNFTDKNVSKINEDQWKSMKMSIYLIDTVKGSNPVHVKIFIFDS